MIEIRPDVWQCEYCETTLGDLNVRDVAYMNSNGLCYGEPTPWRKCTKRGGYCLGHEGTCPVRWPEGSRFDS